MAGRDPWEFAVELESLLALGLTTSDLRWLLSQGYVKHAREVTRPEDAGRSFVACRNLDLPPRTGFVLAPSLRSRSGDAEHEDTFVVVPQLVLRDRTSCAAARAISGPHWDSSRRELWFGSRIVKRYRQPAPNQERVLAAFEEEGWSPRIDDPLPPQPDQIPKRRLQDVIKFLNHNQQNSLIRFAGDGTGRGVLWQAVAEESHAVAPRSGRRARAA